MATDDKTVSPSVGIVGPRAVPRDELGELGGKALQVGGGRKGDLGVDREREEPSTLSVGAGLHAADVPDDGGGGANQMLGRETILRRVGSADARRTRRRLPHQRGIDDEGARPGHEHALDAAAALAFLDQFNQARALEGAQMVIDALPAERELGRQLRGRRGCVQSLEERSAHRRQRQPHVLRPLEHGNRSRHVRHDTIENIFCQ